MTRSGASITLPSMKEFKPMGQLWGLVQAYRDRQTFQVSERQLAAKLGYASSSTFDNWREPKSLPAAQALVRFAVLSGTPYQRVLDAALSDAGYLPEPTVTDESLARPRPRRLGLTEDVDVYADAARRPGRTPRGVRNQQRADAAGEPETNDPDDMDPR